MPLATLTSVTPNTEVYTFAMTPTAVTADQNFAVGLPVGIYRMALYVNGATDAAATITIRPFFDQALTIVSTLDYSLEPSNSSVFTDKTHVTAFTTRVTLQITPNNATGWQEIPLLFGVQVSYAHGAISTGTFTITLLAIRLT